MSVIVPLARVVCAGRVGRLPLTSETVRVSPVRDRCRWSGRLPVVKVSVFVGGETESAVAVGPSLVPLMVMVTVAVSVPPLPSVTV